MVKSDEVMHKNYKEVISDSNLRNNDSIYIPHDCELMNSIYADYEEFIRCVTEERMTRNLDQRKDSAGLTSDAPTGRIYVENDDGHEYYVSIYGAKYATGWNLLFEKELI